MKFKWKTRRNIDPNKVYIVVGSSAVVSEVRAVCFVIKVLIVRP